MATRQKSKKTTELSFGIKIGAMMAAAASAVATGYIPSYINLYYTDTIGMSIGTIGLIIMITKITDGISDIIMGMIIDRTNTKLGKARPWLLAGAFGLAATMMLLFGCPAKFSMLIYGGLQTGASLGTYASYYLYGDSLILVVPIAIAFFPQLIAQLNTDKLCKKFGKKRVYMSCGLLAAVLYGMIYFFGYHNFFIITVLLVLQAAPGNVANIAKTFFTPDTIEYTRYKTGKDCSGIFFSLTAFINKLTTSVASSLGIFLLGLTTWVTVQADSFEDLTRLNVVQPQSALDALWVIYMLIPAIGTLLGVVIMAFYDLKDEDAALMAKCNAGEISRAECEAKLSERY